MSNTANAQLIVIANMITSERLFYILDMRSKSTTEVSDEHLGQIADSIVEWRGPIADRLKLGASDVAEIEAKYPQRLKLQS